MLQQGVSRKMTFLKHVLYSHKRQIKNNRILVNLRFLSTLFVSLICFNAFADEIRIPIPSEAINVITGADQKAEFSGEALQFLGLSGEPQLPYHVMKVLLPPDADLASINVTIENQQMQQLAGDWNIRPIPPRAMCNDVESNLIWPPGKIIFNGKDTEIYGTKALYPSTLVKRKLPGQMRQWQLVDIAIAAFQYNPVEKSLFKLEQGEIVINFTPKLSIKSFLTPTDTGGELVQNALKRLTINFDDISPFYQSTSTFQTFTIPISTYAIITTNDIVTQSTELNKFVQSKQQRGFNVLVLTEDQWGGGIGDQAAENIRNWLQNNYQNSNLEHVLLIGNPNPDYGEVPMKNIWARSHRAGLEQDYTNIIYPSDFYYADLTGNWDLNGNGRYGESGDPYNNFEGGDWGPGGIDIQWEVLVGRIPYYGVINDLDRILLKIRSYENTPKNSIAWRKNTLLAMEPMTDEPIDSPRYAPSYDVGEAIKNNLLLPKNWNFHRIYDEDYGLIPPPETIPLNFSNFLYTWQNKSFGAVFWLTHGNSQGADDIILSSHTGTLNDNFPAFTFQGSCSNAFPENSENLAYAILRNGGLTTLGATRLSFHGFGTYRFFGAPWVNEGLAYEYATRLIGMEQSGGQALFEVKQSYGIETYNHSVAYNIYGDPSIGLLTSSELETENANISHVNVPVRENGKNRLFDSDLSTFWNTDGNPDNAWFELVLDGNYELTQLNLAPRDHRAFSFKVFVDDVFIKEYTTESASSIEFQHFALPAGTIGSKVKIEAINQSWFKIHEVALLGQQTTAPSIVAIIDTEVPIRTSNKSNLHDSNSTTSWNNDGNMANAWFDVILDGSKKITELRLAPRTQRAYTFNVYVDHIFVGQYTTASASTIALQTFDLPAGTAGSIIRIESVSHSWFKVHEIELHNGAPAVSTCGNEIAINDVTVPAREFRKRYLVDDDFSSTSFWTNSGDTWFELSINGEQEINCLQLAPRENRAYTFDVYVDDNFVAQYTTEKANNIALQNFTLPEGTIGSVVRVESVNSNWFKVYEVKLTSMQASATDPACSPETLSCYDANFTSE